jgi:alpha-beta hydrolase superfamily lysophospholipase
VTREILFVHGMFMTGRSWAAWHDRFTARGYVCHAPDWPGRAGNPADLRARPDPALRELTLSGVIAQFESTARACAKPPILIGHSMGGLVVQALLSRGAGSLGIAIDPAPPFGVRSFAFSHLRANLPVLWPSRAPIVPTLSPWKYAFWHTGSDEEVRRAFEAEVVPESRLVGKGPLGPEAKIDFTAKRPPLLMIAGELDTIIPASLVRKAAARYDSANAPTEVAEFTGRTHYLCGQPGWEEVADRCVAFIDAHAG